MNQRTSCWRCLNNGGRPSSAERGSVARIELAGLGADKEEGLNDDTGDKDCRGSSLTAIGGADGNLVWGDIVGESEFAGVGKWGRGNAGTVGETLALALSLTSCCNRMSGDSGIVPMSFSFAFSC